MADKIKPALSKSEWDLLAKHNGEETQEFDSRSVFIGRDGVLSLTGVPPFGQIGEHIRVTENMRHALAALALHDQSFGFTREMLEALRCCVRREGPASRDEELAEQAIARIAALLPPEEG